MGYLLGFADMQEYGSIFFGGVCRICFGANWSDDVCGIHRYREKYGESFETDAKVDFNNNRRDGYADSDYGSEDSWNDHISLAKIGMVDLMSPQDCRVWKLLVYHSSHPTLYVLILTIFTNPLPERMGLKSRGGGGLKEKVKDTG